METITGHVKLAGRANKNNYRARGLSHHRNAWFELFMDSSFAVPRFIILPPLFLRVVCGENGKERVGEGKRALKREGGKETNYYLVPGYTCSFEKSRHSRRNDHAFYSSFSTLLYFLPLRYAIVAPFPAIGIHHRSKSFRVA